jgi:non-ribosomal peptide synthetase component F
VLHQLFDVQANRTPDALALIDGERRVTYRDAGAVNQLAHHLKARGVGPGGLVGVCLSARSRPA